MEIKTLKNELNLGESGFYYIKLKSNNENLPYSWYDAVKVDEGDYITEIAYECKWRGNPEIVYITNSGLHLSDTETFKTKEQALQYAKGLNTARVLSYLDNLMEATNFLGERELLDIDDRVGRFLMEINARFNAFTKTQYPTEGE